MYIFSLRSNCIFFCIFKEEIIASLNEHVKAYDESIEALKRVNRLATDDLAKAAADKAESKIECDRLRCALANAEETSRRLMGELTYFNDKMTN